MEHRDCGNHKGSEFGDEKQDYDQSKDELGGRLRSPNHNITASGDKIVVATGKLPVEESVQRARLPSKTGSDSQSARS
jgi:hypothetical protein